MNSDAYGWGRILRLALAFLLPRQQIGPGSQKYLPRHQFGCEAISSCLGNKSESEQHLFAGPAVVRPEPDA
jgi:hypothetical protein